MRYYCFPDIHGCFDLLNKALSFVYAANPDGGKIIFLGDYIDRGTDTKQVFDAVMNPPKGWEFICLLGNHEVMFVDAMRGKNEFYDPAVALEFVPNAKTAQDVLDKFPTDILEWLTNLKLFHVEGDNVFAHAFYDDFAEKQNVDDVVWTRMSDFESFKSVNDRLFLTHGHTPRKHGPVSSPNRLNLDIGVFAYGQYAIAEYQDGVRGPVEVHTFKWHDYK